MIYQPQFGHLAHRRLRLRHTARTCLALACAALLVTSNGVAVAQTNSGDPANVIYTVDIAKDGRFGKLTTMTIPDQASSGAPIDWPNDPSPKALEAQPSTPSRLQAALEQRVSAGNPSEPLHD